MKKKGVLLALIVGLALLAAGCFHSNPGVPDSYTDQNNRAKNNFEAACTKNNSPNNCKCIFDGFVDYVDFEDFESFNKDLKKNPDLLLRRRDTNDVSISAKHDDALSIIDSCRNSCLTGSCTAERPPVRETST